MGRRKMPKLTVRYRAARMRKAAARRRPRSERVSWVSTGRAWWAAERVSASETKWKNAPASAAGMAMDFQRGRS
jgi:hypothetical protein